MDRSTDGPLHSDTVMQLPPSCRPAVRGFRVSTQTFREPIIHPAIPPAHPPNFLFTDDNTPTHRAGIVAARFQKSEGLVWYGPAMPPDLNPIDHVWDQLQRQLEARSPHLTWQNRVEHLKMLPQNSIMRLVRIMRCCRQAAAHTRTSLCQFWLFRAIFVIVEIVVVINSSHMKIMFLLIH